MRRRPDSIRGFTLVEVLISTSLAGIIIAGILSTFLFLGRNLSRLASYQALENEARKGMVYLRRDFALAKSVKPGTAPTSSTVTLVLPSGDVTYTYDAGARKLRREATFGASPDLFLLSNSLSECTSFEFSYFTTTDGPPTDQGAPSTNVPFSIKQIEVRYTLESPSGFGTFTRTRFDAASARFLFRNRGTTDGT